MYVHNFNFQMYFYDASQAVLIDSLYYGEIYSPGCNTNQLGIPVDSLERKFEVPLTSERVRRLKEAKKITELFLHFYILPVLCSTLNELTRCSS